MLQKFYELLTKDLFLSECSKLGCFWKQRYSVFFILDALGVSTKDWYREKDNKHTFTTEFTRLLHMCFDRFLLAVESRDLSQADKSINRVFSVPNWVMSSKTSFFVYQAWGLNFLKTKFCQSSQIYLSPEKNWENCLLFKLGNFWVINWPKQFCQSAK